MDSKRRAWAWLQNHIQIIQKHSDLRHEEHKVGQKGLQRLFRLVALALLQVSSWVSTTLSVCLAVDFAQCIYLSDF